MGEIRRGIRADNRVERLPWLEPVEDEDDYPGGERGRGWIVAGLALLAVIVLAVIAIVAFRHWHGSREDLGGIIRAPTTPYKVRPINAGGLAVDTSGAVAEQTGHTVNLGVPDGADIVFVERIESMDGVRILGHSGRRQPAHCVSSGLVIAAFNPTVEHQRREAGFPPKARGTIRRVEDWDRTLADVRRQGHAVLHLVWTSSLRPVQRRPPFISPLEVRELTSADDALHRHAHQQKGKR